MSVRFVPLGVVALLVAVIPVAAQQKSIYRDGFAGRNPMFLRGDANIRFEEKDHKMSAEHGHSGLSSESIKIEANPPAGAADVQFVDYYYQTPPAPITERLTASVWVKAFRAGIQVKARVVFPKEKDPRNPNAPLTTLIAGTTYTKVRRWQQLDFGDIADVLKKQLPVLHARLGRAVDPSDAYLDRIVLNVFAGPGITELWIDDLEIGPVRTDLAPPPTTQGPTPGATTGRGGQKKALPVEFTEGQIAVDGNPFLMLAIRHTNTPLKTLHDAGFNTVWFPTDPTPATVEDAVRHGFWIVPSLPLPAGQWVDGKPKQADADTLKRDADSVATFLRQFIANDAVLMWSLGSGRTLEDLPRVARASELVRTYDPRRPRAVDLWDGYSAYSSYVNAMGAHRWPLFSSLEMSQYRQWLSQRRALIPPGKLAWTWVQTHLPEWFAEKLCGQPNPASFDDPIGPHPEQLRILTYLSLAAGYRGLGFWSDKYLENACHGRDRLLELALLNSEIEMLRPVLLGSSDPAKWYPTDNGNVQAAVIRGKDILVLPVWLGSGTQYTPAQGALPSLTIVVPAVPDSAVPWLVTPVGVTELKGVKRVAGGTEIVIPEFDITAAVVFTSDQCGPQSRIVRWQDHTRFKLAPLAARWAQQQAIEQYRKTRIMHENILKAGGPDLPNGEAPDLFRRSAKYIASAKAYAENNQFDQAYHEARRALRPLRVLMRADWQKAVETLDVPTASPFAVSFYSLPQHWKFAQQVQSSRLAGNGFPNGGFELSRSAPTGGAAVSSLPGWRMRKMILDPGLIGKASIVNVTEKIVDPPPQEVPVKPTRYAPLRVAPHPVEFRQPEYGRHCLALSVVLKQPLDKDGQPVPQPQALERVVVAVDSAPAEFAPGSLVRISFWAKVPGTAATADGLVVFDSAGGEPLGVRILTTIPEQDKPAVWKQYHLYRRVPPSGKMVMTFALTGLGFAYIDDVRIEPLIPGAVDAAYCPPLATKPTVTTTPIRQTSYQQQPKEVTRSRDR